MASSRRCFRLRALAGPAAAAALAACAGVRWLGTTKAGPASAPELTAAGPEIAVSTAPRRPRPVDALPKNLDARQKAAVYYSDLGPDALDVSGYPAQQRRNYEIYAHACSQCHTLARSINAPTVNRGFWEFYMLSMRFNSFFVPGTEMPKSDRKAILDFLEYDSQRRKIEDRAGFEELQDELKRLFDALLEERMSVLQRQDQPLPLRAPRN